MTLDRHWLVGLCRMCCRLEDRLGLAAWDLTPAQVLFRIADLDERERDRNRLAALVARASQWSAEDFASFMESLGG